MEFIFSENMNVPAIMSNCSTGRFYKCKYDLYVKKASTCEQPKKEHVDCEIKQHNCAGVHPFKYGVDVDTSAGTCVYQNRYCSPYMKNSNVYYHTYKEYPEGGY